MFDDEEEEFYEGNLREDVEQFEAYLKDGNSVFMDSDRLEGVIDHYLINNMYTKAKIAAEYGLNQFPYNILFHLRKAQAVSATGQLKEALHILANVEKWESPSCEFLLTKASIFSQLRDSKNAIRFFRDALELSEPEDRDEIYLDLAMEYENINDYKNAVVVLRDAINYNPHNEGAIYEIAFCYDCLGEYENAIKCYSDFIDENPYSFTAWYNLGNAYSKLESYEKAIWAYDYCILINENFGPVYFNLANAYLAVEQYQKAIDNFMECLRVDGEDPMAYCYIGEAYEQMNQLDKAKEYYNKSINMAPMLPDAWLGLGIVEDLEGKTTEALTFLHKAAELDPENSGVFHVLGGAYEKLGDTAQATEYYLFSLALDSSDEECLQAYVNLLEKESLKSALAYIREFNEKIGNNELGDLLEVNLLWKTGQSSEALYKFQQCVEANREKAKELFELNPELSKVPEFARFID